MDITKINDEVFYTRDSVAKVDKEDVEFLKSTARSNDRKRARICSHLDAEDALHEMLIVLGKGAYFRPHKHLGKSESFHVIEGDLKVVIFNESGEVSEVIEMGDYNSGKKFYYRLSEDCFHTVVPQSDIVVFHETTNGPFNIEDTAFAPWAPEDDTEGVSWI